MPIGVLEIDLYIPHSSSLKEKRYVLRSIKDRVKKFNVSVAEIDAQDLWQRSKLMVAVVSNDSSIANSILSKVIGTIEQEKRVHVLDYTLRFL